MTPSFDPSACVVAGLVNTSGVSCYLNALLQALAPLAPLHSWLAAVCRRAQAAPAFRCRRRMPCFDQHLTCI